MQPRSTPVPTSPPLDPSSRDVRSSASTYPRPHPFWSPIPSNRSVLTTRPTCSSARLTSTGSYRWGRYGLVRSPRPRPMASPCSSLWASPGRRRFCSTVWPPGSRPIVSSHALRMSNGYFRRNAGHGDCQTLASRCPNRGERLLRPVRGTDELDAVAVVLRWSRSDPFPPRPASGSSVGCITMNFRSGSSRGRSGRSRRRIRIDHRCPKAPGW